VTIIAVCQKRSFGTVKSANKKNRYSAAREHEGREDLLNLLSNPKNPRSPRGDVKKWARLFAGFLWNMAKADNAKK
jgi:hypothetical protein